MKLAFSQSNNPKRQKLIKGVHTEAHVDSYVKSGKVPLLKEKDSSIRTIGELRSAFQTAIELEHSTIPPYLVALYSIKDGTNQVATQIIRSVVIEEMLHMI